MGRIWPGICRSRKLPAMGSGKCFRCHTDGWRCRWQCSLSSSRCPSDRWGDRSRSNRRPRLRATRLVAATRSSINTRLVAPGDSSANTVVNTVQDSVALALLGTLLLSPRSSMKALEKLPFRGCRTCAGSPRLRDSRTRAVAAVRWVCMTVAGGPPRSSSRRGPETCRGPGLGRGFPSGHLLSGSAVGCKGLQLVVVARHWKTSPTQPVYHAHPFCSLFLDFVRGLQSERPSHRHLRRGPDGPFLLLQLPSLRLRHPLPLPVAQLPVTEY